MAKAASPNALSKEGLRVGSLEAALAESRGSSQPAVFTRAVYPYSITHANLAWEALCGYTEEEALGKSCKILQGPDTCRETIMHMNNCVSSGLPVSVRVLNYTKQGAPFMNDLTLVPLSSDVRAHEGGASRDGARGGVQTDGGVVVASPSPSPQPTITHYVGYLNPWTPPSNMSALIGPQKTAFETKDEAAETSSVWRKLPRTLDDALSVRHDALIITEAARPFRIVHVNDAWCSLCGFTAAESIGKTCGILQGPATCPHTIKHLTECVLKGTGVTVRLINYAKDGRPFMNTLALSPLSNADRAVPRLNAETKRSRRRRPPARRRQRWT